MLVQRRYRKFLHCLWMLWHMADIETSRAEMFTQCDSVSGSIKSMIQRFIASEHFITEEQARLYYEAYVYVESVFAMSMQLPEGDVGVHN